MGLGLYLVRALAQAHRGSAEVGTSPSGGCRFRVVMRSLPPSGTRDRHEPRDDAVGGPAKLASYLP